MVEEKEEKETKVEKDVKEEKKEENEEGRQKEEFRPGSRSAWPPYVWTSVSRKVRT